MSAPETNIETQKKRHKGPLIGIAAVVLTVAVLLAFYLGNLAASGQAPGNADVKIDGRTGAEVVVE